MDDERIAAERKEILDTLRHWQFLMLHDVVEDIQTHLDDPGCVDMRNQLADMIVCGLTFVLHGCSPLPCQECQC